MILAGPEQVDREAVTITASSADIALDTAGSQQSVAAFLWCSVPEHVSCC